MAQMAMKNSNTNAVMPGQEKQRGRDEDRREYDFVDRRPTEFLKQLT
jgi:hypothetical protein